MSNNQLTVTLPADLADRLRAGGVDDVSAYVGETVAAQVRQVAIRDYLDACEQAGHRSLTDDELRDFRRMVGEEAARAGQGLRYQWIYDTPSLIGHATGQSNQIRAGLTLVQAQPDTYLTVPVTCLLEAYAAAPVENHQLLDGLATNPGVRVPPAGSDPHAVATISVLVKQTGRPGAAHAAQLALAGDGPCLVFTDTPMPTGVLARPA